MIIARLNAAPWYIRWPIKWAALLATYFLVLFPNPRLFVRHIEHWRDPNAMIDADSPELQPWVKELRGRLRPDMQPPQALKTVEKFVLEKVPYKFDWQTWGSADYLPTLAEVLAMGAEDCDGRAVVAASILRNLGYRAELVTDFAHVWVKTDKGDTMSPGKTRSVVATEKGVEVHWDAVTKTLPEALAYSVSPFPLYRELIALGMTWLVLLHGGIGRRRALLALFVCLEGLLILRIGGANWQSPIVWAQWWGIAHLVFALGLLLVGRRRTPASPPGGCSPTAAAG